MLELVLLSEQFELTDLTAERDATSHETFVALVRRLARNHDRRVVGRLRAGLVETIS